MIWFIGGLTLCTITCLALAKASGLAEAQYKRLINN